MAKIIALVGAHACGKTTIAKKLKSKGYIVREETSKKFHGPASVKEIVSGKFQKKIMNEEFKRDKKINSNLIIVESHHIGNLAHTKLLASKIFNEYKKKFAKALSKHKIYAIFLKTCPEKTIIKRKKLSKKEMKRRIVFNLNLVKAINEIINEFKIPCFYVNAETTKNKVFKEVLSIIRRIENE